MILFSGSHEQIEQAKDYIKQNNLTKDDVRLVKGDDYINVIARDSIPWKSGSCEKAEPTEFYVNCLLQEGRSRAFIKVLYPDWKFKDERESL